MRAKAIAHGAVTVVNAISTGKGAALGIDLWTVADVRLSDHSKEIHVHIKSDPEENPQLARQTVRDILRRFNAEDRYGAEVSIDSNIPIARGLKSSSAAANAIALATVSALGRKLSDVELVKLGVKAAIESKVTITGAFDDACASYFGNLVVTDNKRLRIEKICEISKDYHVLIHVPRSKSYTIKSNIKGMKAIAPLIRLAHRQTLSGNHWDAMCFNGYAHTIALGYNPEIAMNALSAGAVASGLSGKGPATAAVVAPSKVDSVKKAWRRYPGDIVSSRINRKKAHIVR
jgi:shikimate kinase